MERSWSSASLPDSAQYPHDGGAWFMLLQAWNVRLKSLTMLGQQGASQTIKFGHTRQAGVSLGRPQLLSGNSQLPLLVHLLQVVMTIGTHKLLAEQK